MLPYSQDAASAFLDRDGESFIHHLNTLMGYHIWERDGPITHSATAFVAHFCEAFAGPTGDTQAREQPHHLQGIKSLIICLNNKTFRILAAASG